MKNGQQFPDVLTLPEAAKFLRLTPERTEQLAISAQLPGRRIDQEWRFLRAALEEWMRGPTTAREMLMQQAGALADDPWFNEMLAHIKNGNQ